MAAAPHEGPSAFDAVRRFWDYSGAYLHFALAHPAHFRVMHSIPKSEHSRDLMLPRSPAVLAQAAMDALVASGVVAPEVAGRALLACWTSDPRAGLAGRRRAVAAERRADARGRAGRRAAHGHAGRGRRAGAAPARASAARWRLPGAGRARARSAYSARGPARPHARRAPLHHPRRAQAARLRAAGRARAAGRVPRARTAGAQRLQLGALALRRRHRGSDTRRSSPSATAPGWAGYRKAIEDEASRRLRTRRCWTRRSTWPIASTRCR